MQKVIAIVGPTAAGKSALAVALARRFNGEVISADSRQVYKGLNIGTGKITKSEMRDVPHHLLDVASPRRQFTVAEYQMLARQKLEEILSRGRIPIICGGTGLYVDSLLRGTQFPEVPPDWRLRGQLETKPAVELFAILRKLDPRRAKNIDRYNPRRLIRAIEIAVKLGCSPLYADVLKNNRTNGNLFIGLTLPPEELKKRVGIRLFARISEQGLIREVKRLHECGLSWKRMEELGLEYRYISRYLRGLLTKEEMLAKLQTEIYRYGKRQLTWFKRNKKIHWFHPSQKTRIFAMLKDRGL